MFEETLEQRQRPLSVSIVGWLVAIGSWLSYGFAALLVFNPELIEAPVLNSVVVSVVLSLVAGLIGMVCGAGLLEGANWARQFFIVCQVLGIAAMVSFFQPLLTGWQFAVFGEMTVVVVIVGILTTPAANTYFGGSVWRVQPGLATSPWVAQVGRWFIVLWRSILAVSRWVAKARRRFDLLWGLHVVSLLFLVVAAAQVWFLVRGALSVRGPAMFLLPVWFYLAWGIHARRRPAWVIIVILLTATTVVFLPRPAIAMVQAILLWPTSGLPLRLDRVVATAATILLIPSLLVYLVLPKVRRAFFAVTTKPIPRVTGS